MRLTLQRLVRKIIDRFESKLPAQNDASNREAIFKLVLVEKANLVCHIGTKKKPIANKTCHSYLAISDHFLIPIGRAHHQHKWSQTTPKDCNVERHSWAPIQDFSDAVSPLPTAEGIGYKAIDATSSLASPSDTKLTKLAPYSRPLIWVREALMQGQVEIPFTECFLIVQTDVSENEQVLLNLDCLLADNSAPAVMANKLLRASYSTLINALHEEGLLDNVTVEKLWGWVAGGPNPGWWQIRSDFSLQSYLVA